MQDQLRIWLMKESPDAGRVVAPGPPVYLKRHSPVTNSDRRVIYMSDLWLAGLRVIHRRRRRRRRVG